MSSTGLPLILASQSPRRRQLLEQAGYAFQVMRPSDSAECGICTRETPPELVARYARQKAEDVAERVARGVVIGCDTVAECQGQILGKPADRRHANSMLQLLIGQRHRVYSGVCLWRRPDNRRLIRVDVTELRMDLITARDLTDYLDSEEWVGKAGAFGYQDGLPWVHVLHGSESNVVGLPLELLEVMLADLETIPLDR